MYFEHHQRSEPGLVDLVHGIFSDAKELLVEGVSLAKLEVKDELNKAKIAAVEIGIGAGIIAGGAILLLLMAVHVLANFTPIPLWGCYGIVGAVLIAIGGILLVAGKRTVS